MSSAPAARERFGGGSLLSLTALFWGLQFAFLNPSIGLVLVGLYDATPSQVGWALGAYHLSGFVSTLVVPSRADRRGDYLRPMIGCGVLTVLLVTSLALATTLPWAMLALVTLGGPAGVAIGLLFAHQRSTGAPVGAIMRTRAVFSFSWVAGPPIAALLLGLLGQRAVLWSIAVIAVLAIVATRSLQRLHRTAPERPESPVGPPARVVLRDRRVIGILAGFACLGAANTAAVSTMALLVTDRLGVDVLWGGVVLATAAALEIPLLLGLGRATRRFSSASIVLLGAVVAVAYFLIAAATTSLTVLLAAQVLNAFAVAALQGVGLTLVQDVVPRPGLASGLFMNTSRVGAVLAGPAIAVGGSGALGYAGVFVVAAGLALVGALCIMGTATRLSARA